VELLTPSVARLLLAEQRNAPQRIELRETFSVDPRALTEGAKGNITELADGRFRVRCKGQHCGLVNRNNRRYETKKTWGRHTLPESVFMRRVKSRRVVGQLEHPPEGRGGMGLGAIVVTEVEAPNAQGEVWITFETMSTPDGRIAESYIRDGVGFGVSSRGHGSVVRGVDGVDDVQEDYEPGAWDCVLDESTPGSEVVSQKLRESRKALLESVGGDEAKARELCRIETESALARMFPTAPAAAQEKNVTEAEAGDPSTGGVDDEMPPTGANEFLLALPDGAGHYRAYDNSINQWDVWLEIHNLAPKRIAKALQTLAAAKAAAEAHAQYVVGAAMTEAAKQDPNARRALRAALRDAMRAQAEAATKKPVTEDAEEVAAVPFTGTCVWLRDFDSASEAEKAMKALEAAGFHVEQDDCCVSVQTGYTDALQAIEHIKRVLGMKDIAIDEVRVVRHGKTVWADRLSEALPGDPTPQVGDIAYDGGAEYVITRIDAAKGLAYATHPRYGDRTFYMPATQRGQNYGFWPRHDKIRGKQAWGHQDRPRVWGPLGFDEAINTLPSVADQPQTSVPQAEDDELDHFPFDLDDEPCGLEILGDDPYEENGMGPTAPASFGASDFGEMGIYDNGDMDGLPMPPMEMAEPEEPMSQATYAEMKAKMEMHRAGYMEMRGQMERMRRGMSEAEGGSGYPAALPLDDPEDLDHDLDWVNAPKIDVGVAEAEGNGNGKNGKNGKKDDEEEKDKDKKKDEAKRQAVYYSRVPRPMAEGKRPAGHARLYFTEKDELLGLAEFNEQGKCVAKSGMREGKLVPIGKGTPPTPAKVHESHKGFVKGCGLCEEVTRREQAALVARRKAAVAEAARLVGIAPAAAPAKPSLTEMTKDAQDFIGREIAHLVKDKGYEQDRAVAAAYNIAREKGYSVPTAPKDEAAVKAIAGKTLMEHSTPAGEVVALRKRTSYLQEEVTRLEREKAQMTDLVNTMSSVQRAALTEAEIKRVVQLHPELGRIKERLDKAKSPAEVVAEANFALGLLGKPLIPVTEAAPKPAPAPKPAAAPKPAPQKPAPQKPAAPPAPMTEASTKPAAPAKPPAQTPAQAPAQAPAPTNGATPAGARAKVGTTAVESLAVPDAPGGPLTEAEEAALLGGGELTEASLATGTMSRVAAYRRRARGEN
jgi:hypothetical protein